MKLRKQFEEKTEENKIINPVLNGFESNAPISSVYFFHDGAPLIEQRTEGESGYVLATYVPAYFLDFNICSFQSY